MTQQEALETAQSIYMAAISSARALHILKERYPRCEELRLLWDTLVEDLNRIAMSEAELMRLI